MKRHPALQDLSRDHHFVLLHARDIDWIAKESPHASPMEEVVTSFLSFWEQEGEWHFQEEEALLFPPLRAQDPEAEPIIEHILEDHRWIRARATELADRVEAGEPHEDLLFSLGRRLHDHARYEERVLFERIQEVLNEETLTEIGERSKAFRRDHRGPQAIGPRGE